MVKYFGFMAVVAPYTKQYSLILNAADASHDGIDLLINVGNLPPTPGYKTPPLTAMYQPMMMHQTHSPSPVALSLRFLGVTYVNTS